MRACVLRSCVRVCVAPEVRVARQDHQDRAPAPAHYTARTCAILQNLFGIHIGYEYTFVYLMPIDRFFSQIQDTHSPTHCDDKNIPSSSVPRSGAGAGEPARDEASPCFALWALTGTQVRLLLLELPSSAEAVMEVVLAPLAL